MDKRADYLRMIRSARWLKLRREKLEACPLCESCRRAGRLVSATEVHHARPVESSSDAAERERLMFDYFNLRSLCHRCHLDEHARLGKNTKAERAKRREGERSAAISKLFGGQDPGGHF